MLLAEHYGSMIVIFLRLLIPFSILRWPIAGAILSIIFDTVDVVILSVLGHGSFYTGNYTRVDNALDTFFLLLLLIVAFKWKDPLAKYTCIALFTWRVIGVIMVEFTDVRELLFVFPNLFVLFYLFWALRNRFFPHFVLTWKRLLIILIVLLIPKLLQEYALHVAKLQPWTWIKSEFLSKLLKINLPA